MMRRLRTLCIWALEFITLALLGRWLAIRMRRVLLLPTNDSTAPISESEITPGIRRIIVSDLHLGGRDRLDDFLADNAFAEFVRCYVINGQPVELILAGDTFELLQLRVPELGDYEWSGEAAERRLQLVLSAHPDMVAALREFVAQDNHQLTLLIGNHDFELHYAKAKQLLRQALGVTEDDPRVRFGLRYEGDGIYLEHGNQFDEWNRFVRFDGISEPFEVVRGTRVVKDVINKLEEDALDVAPLLDNVKPTSAFLWYLLALPRFRQREVRRYVIRGLLLLFRSVALPRSYMARPELAVREELLGPPGTTLQQELAIQAVYQSDPALRQAAAAQYGGVEPQVRLRKRPGASAALAQALARWIKRTDQAPEQALDAIEREAKQQLRHEIREFKDVFVQAMVQIAASNEHRANRLFVCGHTHLAQVVALNDEQVYINTGTWTEIIRDISAGMIEQRRFPFLEVQPAEGNSRPVEQLLVWRGRDLAPRPWDERDEPEDRAAT